MKSFVEFVFNFLQTSHHHAHIIYLIFLALAYLDSIAFLGLLIPGTWIVLSVGVFVANTSLCIPCCILFLTLGAFSSDTTSFLLGKFFSPKMIFVFKRYPSALEKGKNFFKRYGGISLLLARFIGPLRPIIPFVWGMFNLSIFRFCVIDAISSFVSISTLFGIGFLMGRSILELKNVDPWILVLLLLFFVVVFIFFKILWKSLLKLEMLGLEFISSTEVCFFCQDLIQRKKAELFFRRNNITVFLTSAILLAVFIPSFLFLLSIFKSSVETSVLSILVSLEWMFKWVWIFFNFINKPYTLLIISLTPIFLFYLLNLKKLSFCWFFSLSITFLMSSLFYISSAHNLLLFNSSFLVFSIISLFFLGSLKWNFSSGTLFGTIFLSFLLTLVDLFSYKHSPVADVLTGDFLGLLGSIVFFLLSFRKEYDLARLRYVVLNLAILLVVTLFIYLKPFDFRQKEIRFQTHLNTLKKILFVNKDFLTKKHLIYFRVCGSKREVEESLKRIGWKKYSLKEVLYRPLSKEKLILLFADLRIFFSSSWYGFSPDLAFVKKQKKIRYMLKLWKVGNKEFICFAWSNQKDLKNIKKVLTQELNRGGIGCE